ncbi:phage protein Gp27 family protein [Shinella sp. HZN7]|uniref:phage protein Gp27 family protein n=1 Tax=Shinella sp. (strain HZN7) TaxID=879274 RepID=UPI0007DA6DD6|nr:phage protein Gp27 family protein [Shinella sp. HZN7]ANH04614.1 hypothetical protein shn_11580 [Shinella sp. HZN7]
MAPHTRPRPTAVDQLPDECEGIVAWAAQELAKTGRAQTDIYAEFRTKLIALQGELGIGFDIPHYSSFTRHNMRLKALMDRQRRAQMIADAVITSSDGQDADRLTQASTRMLKTLIVEMMENAADGGFKPKEAANAAVAVRHLAAAEIASTNRRQKLQAEQQAKRIEAEMKAKAEAALDLLENEPGVSKAAIRRAREKFLGVRPKTKRAEDNNG